MNRSLSVLPRQDPIRRAVRARTLDHAMSTVGLTFDAAAFTADGFGNQLGMSLGRRCTTHDGRTVDSTGAFLVGELERLDQTMHMPLVSTTWGRDIDLREDVSIGDDVSSYTNSTFASVGGLGTGNGIGNGKAWAQKNSTQLAGVGLDISKTPSPLTLWGVELHYSIPELASAAQTGRPVDAQKYEAMQTKHQMDEDEQVYIGDTSLGFKGMVNSAAVTNVANVPVGASNQTFWSTKTPDEILADVNEMLTSGWAATGYSQIPEKILLPPVQFGYIATQKVSQSGTESILSYIKEKNVKTANNKGPLEINAVKWAVGAGAGGTIGTADGHDRMMAYTKQKRFLRFPATMLQRTPVQYQGIYHKTSYFCKFGVVEIPYPETVVYRDLI